MFIIVLFTIAKSWKQPKCPSVDERIKKLWYIYTMGYYIAERVSSYLLQQMELQSIMLREISQVVKEKFHVMSLIRGI